MAIVVTWSIGAILTKSGVYDNASAEQKLNCRTDNMAVLNDSPWFRFPYPGGHPNQRLQLKRMLPQSTLSCRRVAPGVVAALYPGQLARPVPARNTPGKCLTIA